MNAKRMIFYGLVVVTSTAAFFGVVNKVSAESTELPEVMVGQTQVVFIDEPKRFYYAGMTGNEAIINYEPNIILGFNQKLLANGSFGSPAGCYDLDFTVAPSQCFALSPNTTSIRMMNSRTSVDNFIELETGAIYYPTNMIIGDAYTNGSYLNNFAFYGRNLNQSGSNTSGDFATWELANYTFNPQAQASYSENQKAYFDNKINNLVGEGKKVTEAVVKNNHTRWYMQSATDLSTGNLEASIYPEGKIWNVDSGTDGVMALLGDYNYQGTGTLVVDGNLTIFGNTSIFPAGVNDSLGIIVKGDVTIWGNVKLNAAVFATGTVNISGNIVDAQGSYVAAGFSIPSARRYVRFRYDYKLDDNWPPGFRFFSMPTATNESM
ncbi:hypothetical protein A2215_01660 [Candidatus Berkelbacteria bacterium RIFOXYA2_FULL_43_10]|uniref:Uncharacterized protein n=1 Tax=Candidatus Berkelbacteria bacterium RIFOXYA2_FULL_43_10 TaxID=1797472 RepID=A0A1F5E714_9BACT|nr:MAG: hypothetical protein A2215_01660 [Candidatus Berkelbacteria bacterium RIFOXYA2_FULL_43_10]